MRTGSGAHAATFSVGTGGSFQRVQHLGCEADCLPPSSAEVKNKWSYTCIHPYHYGLHRVDFTVLTVLLGTSWIVSQMEDIKNKNTFPTYSIGFEAYNFTGFFSSFIILYNIPVAICILHFY